MKKGDRVLPAFLVMTLLSTWLLAGCWDRVEINDRAWVLAFSIDKEADGQYRLSLQLPLVGSLGGPTGGGGGTSGDKSFYVDSAIGPTLREASNILQSRMSRQIYYAHHRVIIIGEDLAKSGLREILDIVARFPENRLTSYVVMAKGKGVDVLKAQPQLERFSAEAMRELVKLRGVTITVKDLAQMLNTPGIDAHLPVVEAVNSQPKGKQKEIQGIGYSVFRDDKMVYFLERNKSNTFRWFQPTFHFYSALIPIRKNKFVNVQVDQGKLSVKPIPKNDHVHFRMQVAARAKLIEDHSGLDWGDRKNIRMLEKKLAEQISGEIRQTLLETVNQHQSDPIGLGLILARNYPRLWKQKYRENWTDHLKNVTYEIHIRTSIQSVGQTTENLTEEEPRR
ncbi:Ger(x)C family spore germination protein [Brevibacillus ruminantium]|uniref:Ger(X)C family spore germination protein n=1 Tax=Brevibacillus ruminantium TaxID=2950604 RepID=A0ABY4WPC7_9BACL|nr:Ger(x)C family spore germination protein [Brevibacillus ruminantium]USG67720.1 Ger(x)C family spore germination protein [Brevibacillus ruminantium]